MSKTLFWYLLRDLLRIFIVTSGTAPGAHVPMSFRTRDAAGFEAQRDTYVVAVP